MFTTRNYRLIEAAGGAVADAILARFAQVNAVRITVRKPHAPIAAIFGDAGITITRQPPWLRRCLRSAAMSATCARRSIAQ